MKHAIKLSLVLLAAVLLSGCSDSASSFNWKFWEKSAAVPVEFKIAEFKPAAGLVKTALPDSDQVVYLHPKALLTNADIASTAVSSGDNGHIIEVVFTEAGRKAFAKVTTENIDKHLVIIADGEIVSAPIIKAPITGGAALIAGEFTKEEAERIANGITK